jgi:hypothetical protein
VVVPLCGLNRKDRLGLAPRVQVVPRVYINPRASLEVGLRGHDTGACMSSWEFHHHSPCVTVSLPFTVGVKGEAHSRPITPRNSTYLDILLGLSCTEKGALYEEPHLWLDLSTDKVG